MARIFSYKAKKEEKLNGTYYRNMYPDAKEILKNKDKGVFREFINICKLSQNELKKYLDGRLREFKYDVINEDGFLYAKGNIPVLLTAHMDTVHKNLVKRFYIITREDGKHVITSPQGIGGDDRCGIYMILKVLEAGFRPYVLFCEDEERGGIGSDKFVTTEYIKELEKLKYMIELDRANEKDAVFYDCENDEFTNYILIKTEFEESWGTFSDISTLAPAAGVAAVNLSCGYYYAHTVKEEVVYEEMMATESIVEKLLESIDECKEYEYIEGYYSYYSNGKGYRNYDVYGKDTRNNIVYKDAYESSVRAYCYDDYSGTVLHVLYENENGEAIEDYTYAKSEGEAWKEFFMNNKYVCWANVLDYDYDSF